MGFYLIGLSIGLIFLVVFLKNKAEETGTSFCYLPNCRVLKELRSKPLTYSPEFQKLLDAAVVDSLDIAAFLTDGDIDFKNSDTQSAPCNTYLIESPEKQETTVLVVENCQDRIVLKRLEEQ